MNMGSGVRGVAAKSTEVLLVIQIMCSYFPLSGID